MKNLKVALFASLTETVRFVMVTFILTLAAGCGSDPVSDTTTATTAEMLKCTTNADCGDGGVCIQESGLCRGPAGKDGVNGTNGTDGKDGVNGTNGTDGKDAVLPTCQVDTDCDVNEYCNSMKLCIRDEAEPVPECTIDADCAAGSQWCEKDSIFKTEVSCISGACVPKDYFIEACDYGCTDGTGGCHSAPGSVCPVGAECDDGDPTTNYDKCNEAGVCAGHYEAPPEADCHFNPGGAGFIFKGSGPTQLRLVWTFNPGGQVDPEFSEIVLASPGQEFWNTTATGVYMRPTDSADPNWWNKGHDQKVQECKLLVTCLNVCHEQFISAPTQYDADCECPFDGGLGPS